MKYLVLFALNYDCVKSLFRSAINLYVSVCEHIITFRDVGLDDRITMTRKYASCNFKISQINDDHKVTIYILGEESYILVFVNN